MDSWKIILELYLPHLFPLIISYSFHYAALTTKGELFVGSLLTDRYIECFKEKYVLSISFADVRIAALVINRT